MSAPKVPIQCLENACNDKENSRFHKHLHHLNFISQMFIFMFFNILLRQIYSYLFLIIK